MVNEVDMRIPMESPSDFYNRTIHNQNPGVAALDNIGNYVADALTLPPIHEPF